MNERHQVAERSERSPRRNKKRKPGPLPMLPGVVMRLLQLDPKADDYFDELTKLAERDPPLAVKILRLANGSTSAPRVPIVDVRAAIARLGASATASTVTAAAVMRVFVPSTAGQKALWTHAVEVATCARALASMDPQLQGEANAIYTCGLLHDIGRFFMFERDAESFREVASLSLETLPNLVDDERALFKQDHCELGYRACRAWKLPDRICRLVRQHHTLGDVDADIEGWVRAIQVGDLVSIGVLDDEDWRALPQPKLIQLLEDRCVHADWPRSPFNLHSFAGRLKSADQESRAMIEMLGLA